MGQSRLDLLDRKNGSLVKPASPAGGSSTDSGNNGTDLATEKHYFIVRLLGMRSVEKEDRQEATRVVCVLIDNFTVVDGHFVDEVLSRVPGWKISSTLKVEYYSGKLYKSHTDSPMKMHLPLIIGVSLGEWIVYWSIYVNDTNVQLVGLSDLWLF